MKIQFLCLVYALLGFTNLAVAGLPDAIVTKYKNLDVEKVGSELAKMKSSKGFAHLDETMKFAKERPRVVYVEDLLADKKVLNLFTENLSDHLQSIWVKEALDAIEAGKAAKAAGKPLPEGITGWQKDIINGSPLERMKPFKLDGQLLKVKSQDELNQVLAKQNIPKEYWSQYRIQPNGEVQVNILSDVPNRYLGSSNKLDNFKSAEAVSGLITYYLKNGGKTDPESLARFMHKAADIVHQKWLSRNHEYAGADQLKSFDELSKSESRKDIVMVDSGFDILQKTQIQYLEDVVAKIDNQIEAALPKNIGNKTADDLTKTRAIYSNKLNALKARAKFGKIKAPEATAGTR